MLWTVIRARSNPPKGFEPGGGELGIAHRVLNVFMAEVGLKGAGVVALGRQRKPAGMPEHVRMRLEAERRFLPGALDNPREACRGER